MEREKKKEDGAVRRVRERLMKRALIPLRSLSPSLPLSLTHTLSLLRVVVRQVRALVQSDTPSQSLVSVSVALFQPENSSHHFLSFPLSLAVSLASLVLRTRSRWRLRHHRRRIRTAVAQTRSTSRTTTTTTTTRHRRQSDRFRVHSGVQRRSRTPKARRRGGATRCSTSRIAT